MSDDWTNELAAVLGGNVSGAEKEILLEKLLSEPTAAEVLSLMALPQLRVENNLPLPFETEATFLGGVCQGFILPVVVDGLEYERHTTRLMEHLFRIFGKEVPQAIERELALEYPDSGDRGPLDLSLKLHGDGDSLGLTVNLISGQPGNIELWENGALVLKAPSKVLSQGSPFEMKLGTSVAVRESHSSKGVRILVSETEFTLREWKTAFVSACVGGKRKDALRILGKHLMPTIGEPDWVGKICGRIEILSTVTKAEGFLLKPLPITRSHAIDIGDRMLVYGAVWREIVHYWPAAEGVPNPWSGNSSDLNGEVEGSLDRDVRDLALACVQSAKNETVSSKPSGTLSDPRIGNGWASVEGWGSLLAREYSQAYEIFSSAVPLSEDPFAVGLGAILADHLKSFDSEEEGPDLEGSSNRVWMEVLSSVF